MGAGIGSSAGAAGMNAMGPQPQDIAGNLGPAIPQPALAAGPPPPDISGVLNGRPGLAGLQAQAPQPQGPSTLSRILQKGGQIASALDKNMPRSQGQGQGRSQPINFAPAPMPFVPPPQMPMYGGGPMMMNPNFYGG
jgi:hypothetical protein